VTLTIAVFAWYEDDTFLLSQVHLIATTYAQRSTRIAKRILSAEVKAFT
jgi:hypothetical protein